MYAAELASGELVRFGALLKDSVSGKVVAHLQETGMLQQVLGKVSVLPFSPVSALTAMSSVGANIQLQQLTNLVQTLQMLQVANLGLSISGIGISVTGFAIINKKLNALGNQISLLKDQVEKGFNEIKERELRSHFSKLRGLFNQADQAHAFSNPATEWLRISNLLAEEGSFLEGELAHYRDTPVFAPDLFLALTTSYGLCNAGRIQCLLLARELRAAHLVSEDNATLSNSLFDQLKPIQLARNMNADQLFEGKSVGMDVNTRLRTMQRFVGSVRDIQDGMNSKPYIIETLISKKIDGFEYLGQLRQQKIEPLLLMRTS